MEENREPEMNPHLYSQLVLNRGRNHIQWAKGSLFNKLCWENRTGMCRKMTLDLLTPHWNKYKMD